LSGQLTEKKRKEKRNTVAGEPFRDNTKFSSYNRGTPWKMRPRCPNGCHGVTVQVLTFSGIHLMAISFIIIIYCMAIDG
jgi:hypothetical protein